MLHKKTNLKSLLFSLIFLSFLACKKDADDEPILPSDEDHIVVSHGTLTMTTSLGKWITNDVMVLDNGDGTFCFTATSQEGGALILPVYYDDGLDSYHPSTAASGPWTFSNDTTVLPFEYFYDYNVEAPGESFITISEHNKQDDNMSGSFDLWFVMQGDESEFIHLLGEFQDVPVTAKFPLFESMTSVVDGLTFESDYDMIDHENSIIRLVSSKDLEKSVTVKIIYDELESSTLYNVADLNNVVQFEVFYHEVLEGAIYLQYTGYVEIYDNQLADQQLGIPGHISGSYSVSLQKLNNPDDLILVEGEFDVTY